MKYQWKPKSHSLMNILQKEQYYQIQALRAQMKISHFMLTHERREYRK